MSCSAAHELKGAGHPFDSCSRCRHFDLPRFRDFVCSFGDPWCEVKFGRPNRSRERQDFHAFGSRPHSWSPQMPVSIGAPMGAVSGKGNRLDVARLWPKEYQGLQHCAQKNAAARHESTFWLCCVQGFFARNRDMLPSQPLHCMHISWCNAACHHHGGIHIRKRCGACFRRFGLKRQQHWFGDRSLCSLFFSRMYSAHVLSCTFCFEWKNFLGKGYSYLFGPSFGCSCCVVAFSSGMADTTAIPQNAIFRCDGWLPEADQSQGPHRPWCNPSSPSSQPGLAGSDFARLMEALRKLLCHDKQRFVEMYL